MAERERELLLDVNVENEQIVLGALIRSSETRSKFLAELVPGSFRKAEHVALATALKELAKRGADYAADSVVQLSGEKVSLKYLRDLAENFDELPVENFRIHLGMLQRDAAKASAQEPFADLYGALDDPHAPLEDVEDAALSIVRSIRASRSDDRLYFGKKLSDEHLAEVTEFRKNREAIFRPFHFDGLDQCMFEGVRPGRMTVVGARPGMGKSTWTGNLVIRQARRGKRCLVAALDDGKQSYIERMACCVARVPVEKIVKDPRKLSTSEWDSYNAAVREILDNERIVFVEEISSVEDLESVVFGGLFDLVVVDLFDYLITGDARVTEVTEALRAVKNLGKPTNGHAGHHTIAVHQIRRSKRVKNPRPTLQELKNAGGYEEVPDNVLLLHRPRYYDKDAEAVDIIEVNIAKQRRGPMNLTIGYEFDAAICRVGKRTTDFDDASDLSAFDAPAPKSKNSLDDGSGTGGKVRKIKGPRA